MSDFTSVKERPRPSEEAAALKSEVFELESLLGQAFARMRAVFGRVEEAAARAERVERERGFRTYTEAEVAAKFQVSEATIFRLRGRLKLPHLRVSNAVRYTDEHVAAIAEALERNGRVKPHGK